MLILFNSPWKHTLAPSERIAKFCHDGARAQVGKRNGSIPKNYQVIIIIKSEVILDDRCPFFYNVYRLHDTILYYSLSFYIS